MSKSASAAKGSGAAEMAAPEVEMPRDVAACALAVDEYLEQFLKGRQLPGSLLDAVRYALLGGGKRLRPILAWYGSVAVGGRGEDSLPAGGAVELVHAFSLVHDDLPALDNDDLRRGRPTLHVHAGEAMAILAGDAMLSLALELVAERGPRSVAGELARELASATGAMIGGQVYDTLGVGRGSQAEQGLGKAQMLAVIHKNKTGALIRAACRMGAMCGLAASDNGRTGAAPGAEEGGVLERISEYGEAVGLMFQVVDDLVDVEQTAAHAGKRTGKDAEAGKLTYPAVYGIERSRAEVERLRQAALAALSGLGDAAEPLRAVCNFLAVRTK